MPRRINTPARTRSARSVRQSVTIPAQLVPEVRRVAKERNLTISAALLSLAEQGIRAELDAKRNLKDAHRRFMSERESTAQDAAGRDLIRAIFGEDAIAEDKVL